MELNFSDMYEASNSLVTGEFDVVVQSVDATTSSTGKPQLRVRATVEGGPNHGHGFFHVITISQDNASAMRMFFVTMAGYGFSRDYFMQNPSLEQIAADLNGRRAHYEVDSRTYQGIERENVKKVSASGLTGPGTSLPSLPGLPKAAEKAVETSESQGEGESNQAPVQVAQKTSPPDLPF